MLDLARITAAILRDQKSMLTVSVVPEGEFGLSGLALSIPCIISSRGVERVVASPLTDEETEKL